MDNDHWFDALNKALVRDAPRRTLLGAAAAIISSFALGAGPGAEAAKNRKTGKGKKNGKKNGKKKDKGKPKPTPSCSGGACALEWAGDQDEIDYCEFVCEQCDGADPRQFCILKPSSGDKVAWCCDEDATCCDEFCCSDFCCDPGGGRPRRCINDEFACCPDDPASGVCDLATHLCCPGVGCVEGLECPDDGCDELCVGPALRCCDGECVNITEDEENCGSCGVPCIGPGLECCNGACVDTREGPNHCGGCNQPCRAEELKYCCDGTCAAIRFDNAHCGFSCDPCPAGRECCHGQCIDTQQLVCCRDHPPSQFPYCHVSRYCCTNANGSPFCCAP